MLGREDINPWVEWLDTPREAKLTGSDSPADLKLLDTEGKPWGMPRQITIYLDYSDVSERGDRLLPGATISNVTVELQFSEPVSSKEEHSVHAELVLQPDTLARITQAILDAGAARVTRVGGSRDVDVPMPEDLANYLADKSGNTSE
jgi:hypothetical protein